MKKQVGNTMRRVPVRARARLKVLARTLGDILETLWHGLFAAPERQVAVMRVKTENRGRKSSG
ncbi:MAG TPA: hypothetical protein VGW33_09220 [Terriglobia bacterium]|nr:hypothetical protein [Terriglobia bacterium]